MPDDETIDTTTATTDGTATTDSASTTATTETATVSVETATASASPPAQVVYVGPKLRSPFPVVPKTIFRGDLPVPLAAAVAADEDLAACFVPVSDFGAALVALKRDGTVISRSVAAVKARYVTKKEG